MNDDNAPDTGGHQDTVRDPAEIEAAGPAKKRRLRLVLGSAAILALILGVGWFIRHQTYGKFQQSTEDAYFQADSVTASSRVSGYIEQVLVTENQDVKAGQPLLRIDVRDYDAQAAQGQAQIDLAAANADNARAMISEQDAAIDQAQAMLVSARSKAGFAAGQVARYTPLVATGAEPAEKLAMLRDQAAQARQDVAAQQAALESARRHIAGLRAQLAQAQAQGRNARAQAQAAQVNVGSAIVRASVAGRVGDLTARAGQFVQPGQRLMSVVPVKQIYLEANFKETQLGLMRPGQPAHIAVDALPGLDIHGHVASLAPGTGAQFSLLPPQNATGNFTKIVQRVPVRIAIDADPALKRLLIPGLSVEVSVDTRSAKDEVDQMRARQDAYRDGKR
ncbi:membrane fusion protein (multidrug efflux system) [Sphingobium sp. OAS761]|uniref:HlyD family secretion protein n=1 Tax=Sphingobium sp. OAS761 TaxID=2817901 RepID=UPI00209C798D|nr:HlyD family secretion protein [Sphingobium sp. OAS761]MCP1471696.1 membrane fusion protein (multidrug efflux system) [Sphingobium sp. OAS761]